MKKLSIEPKEMKERTCCKVIFPRLFRQTERQREGAGYEIVKGDLLLLP